MDLNLSPISLTAHPGDFSIFAKGEEGRSARDARTDMQSMPDKIASLSPRQLEILRLVAAHRSSKEIALLLQLSPATIDSHIAVALRRLELGSRREAAAAIERHMQAPHPPPEGDIPNRHHGGDPPPQSTTIAPSGDRAEMGGATGYSGALPPLPPWRTGWRQGGGGPRAPTHGMGHALFRCFLDAVYTIVFFVIMSSAAYGAHWVVKECEALHIDPTVLLILKLVTYVFSGFDAVGVVCATGLLTFRFVRAIWRADD